MTIGGLETRTNLCNALYGIDSANFFRPSEGDIAKSLAKFMSAPEHDCGADDIGQVSSFETLQRMPNRIDFSK